MVVVSVPRHLSLRGPKVAQQPEDLVPEDREFLFSLVNVLQHPRTISRSVQRAPAAGPCGSGIFRGVLGE